MVPVGETRQRASSSAARLWASHSFEPFDKIRFSIPTRIVQMCLIITVFRGHRMRRHQVISDWLTSPVP